MPGIFDTLTRAVAGTPVVAMAASFVWGVLSIVLSPCHLASIPLIVAFIDGQGPLPTRRAFALSVFFSVGILTTIGVIGAVTAAFGRLLGDIGPWGNYFVAVVFLLIGLYFLEVVSLPLPDRAHPNIKRKGLLAAFILGLLIGTALGPCTFAYMAPMLAVTFREAAVNFSYGLWLLFLYALGHCGVLVLAGTFTELVEHLLHWNEQSRGAVILKKICGVLIVLAGLYLIYTA